MVEAAHIHPFVEAGDDDPRNGIALTPNMHGDGQTLSHLVLTTSGMSARSR